MSENLTPEITVDSSAPADEKKIDEVDRLALELAKSRRQTALAEAKTALAQNENAELSYKYIVLQIYMKYSLTSNDALDEATGQILFNNNQKDK